jgi:hypothetical protein
MNKVKIVHDETGQEAEVVETSVNAWETVGWTRVEDEGSQKSEQDAEVVPGEQVVVTEQSAVPQTATPQTKAKNGGPATPDTSKKE